MDRTIFSRNSVVRGSSMSMPRVRGWARSDLSIEGIFLSGFRLRIRDEWSALVPYRSRDSLGLQQGKDGSRAEALPSIGARSVIARKGLQGWPGRRSRPGRHSAIRRRTATGFAGEVSGRTARVLHSPEPRPAGLEQGPGMAEGFHLGLARAPLLVMDGHLQDLGADTAAPNK